MSRRRTNFSGNFLTDRLIIDRLIIDRRIIVVCRPAGQTAARVPEMGKLVHDVLDCCHRVNLLVNVAGPARDRSIGKVTEEEWLAQ